MKEAPPERELEALLTYLQRTRGFDFSAYKRPSLGRRIQRRVQALGLSSYGEYLDHLEVHPNEFVELFNTILINVTSFFRDPETWDYLAREVIPRILAEREAPAPVRVWSAGCATGEEPYTAAMLFAEAMGVDAFVQRVKIYASNVDEDALARARNATYTAADVEEVPPNLLEKYFEKNDDRYVFQKDLRRCLIFGRHDLLQDAPISRIDLLICRNTLMYFNAEAQERVLARFHFALNSGGFLFLGRAETFLAHSPAFSPVDLKRRIFVKTANTNPRDRLLLLARTGRESALEDLENHQRLRDAALDVDAIPQIVCERGGTLVIANQPARALFGLAARDVGRAVQDLALYHRPAALQGPLEQAFTSRHPVTVPEAELVNGDDVRHFDLNVVPIVDGTTVLGAKILYVDVTRRRLLQAQLAEAQKDLETTRHELETTNEELESTNEELETTNEELQSSNEELETMNEELQSSNEELRTMNEEIVRRGLELDEVNSFLGSILASLQVAVVVVDRDLNVRVWSRKAEELWGLRAEEVQGASIVGLDIGFPVDSLRKPLRDCLSGTAPAIELAVDAVNRRGRKIRCRVTGSPLLGGDDLPRGVILLMEDSASGD